MTDEELVRKKYPFCNCYYNRKMVYSVIRHRILNNGGVLGFGLYEADAWKDAADKINAAKTITNGKGE